MDSDMESCQSSPLCTGTHLQPGLSFLHFCFPKSPFDHVIRHRDNIFISPFLLARSFLVVHQFFFVSRGFKRKL